MAFDIRLSYEGSNYLYDCALRSTTGHDPQTCPLECVVIVSDLSPLIKHIKYADDTTLYHTVGKDNSTISESTARHVKVTLHIVLHC